MVVISGVRHTAKSIHAFKIQSGEALPYVYDRHIFARALGIDLNDPGSSDRLDSMVGSLLDGRDQLLWWAFVRMAESRMDQAESHARELGADHLTGALNSLGFEAWMRERLTESKLRCGLHGTCAPAVALAFILVDLVNFKKVNDQLSYAIGDEVIKRAVVQLRSILRRSDQATVIRFRGDELGVAVANVSEEVGWRIMRSLHHLQLDKISHNRNRMHWRKISQLKRHSPAASPSLELRLVSDCQFDQHFCDTKMMVFINGEPAVEVDELTVMSAGFAYSTITSTKDCEALVRQAELNMKEMKHTYQQYMGGAYRK